MNIIFQIFINILFVISTQADEPLPSCGGRFEILSKCIHPNRYCNPHCYSEGEPLIFCTDECAVGCACIPDYVRDFKTNKCIPKQYCPAPGDPNAEFSKCHADIQPTCEHTCSCHKKHPKKTCVPGYVCRDCYVKNSNRWCVLPKDC